MCERELSIGAYLKDESYLSTYRVSVAVGIFLICDTV